MQEFNRKDLQQRRLSEFEPKKPEMQEPHPDEYYDDHDEPGFFERFRFALPILIIAIIGFVAYSWYTDKFAISKSDSELMVIKASTDLLREKPEDPGGMKIINRDKKIYDAISGKDTDKAISDAKILPEPEEPISREDIAKQAPPQPEVISQIPEKTPAVETDTTIPERAVAAEVAKIDSAPIALVQNTPAPQVKADIAPSVAPAAGTPPIPAPIENIVVQDKNPDGISPEKEIKQESKPIEKVQIKEVTTADIIDVASVKKAPDPSKNKKANTGYKVQLGSYRSEGDASASLKVMKKKFPDIIKDLKDYIEKADLGDKGVYYRLQLSGFKSESDARKVCQKLTDKKQGCFFVGK